MFSIFIKKRNEVIGEAFNSLRIGLYWGGRLGEAGSLSGKPNPRRWWLLISDSAIDSKKAYILRWPLGDFTEEMGDYLRKLPLERLFEMANEQLPEEEKILEVSVNGELIWQAQELASEPVEM